MRVFKSQECFDRHKQTVGNAKSICGSLVKCPDCHTVVKRDRLGRHHCGLTLCSTCKEYVHAENHQCYMQPEKERNTTVRENTDLLDTEAHDGDDAPQSGYNELLFFDFECRQENGNHEPNLCVVQNEAGDECKLYRVGSQLSRLRRLLYSTVLTRKWRNSRSHYACCQDLNVKCSNVQD